MDTNRTVSETAAIVVAQVAARVERRAKDAGLNPVLLAERTGIARSTLLRRLSGASPFTVAELAAVAGALDVSLSDLIAGTAGSKDSTSVMERAAS